MLTFYKACYETVSDLLRIFFTRSCSDESSSSYLFSGIYFCRREIIHVIRSHALILEFPEASLVLSLEFLVGKRRADLTDRLLCDSLLTEEKVVPK